MMGSQRGALFCVVLSLNKVLSKFEIIRGCSSVGHPPSPQADPLSLCVAGAWLEDKKKAGVFPLSFVADGLPDAVVYETPFIGLFIENVLQVQVQSKRYHLL